MAIGYYSSSGSEDGDHVKFYGHSIRTTVTASALAVIQWIDDIYRIHERRLHNLIIGLDVKWQRNFIRNQQSNDTATLQLCIGDRFLLFQLLHADGIPLLLREFLDNSDFTFVGAGIEEDVQKVENDYQLSVRGRKCDLGALAVEVLGEHELKLGGLKRLAARVLGVNVDNPRKISMSEWGAKTLNPEQVKYACIRSYVAFEIGRVLLGGHTIRLFPDGRIVQADMSNAVEITHSSKLKEQFIVKFCDESIVTTITNIASVVDDWLHEIRGIYNDQITIVGLHTERCRPNDRRKYCPIAVPQVDIKYCPIAILQLCVGIHCLIFQLTHAKILPKSLVEFLDDPNMKFVGVGVQEDALKLSNDYRLSAKCTEDLTIVAAEKLKNKELEKASLKTLANTVLGVQMEKPKKVTFSRWDFKVLSLDQVHYATVDAFVSSEIGRSLMM